MDLTFSAKSQTVTLISCTHLSTLSSIRREFLGCCHNLRPPGGPHRLRFRRSNCEKLGFHKTNSQRLMIKASLDSNSILVVVAVTTLSALSIAYYLNNKKKKNKSSIEVLGYPSFVLSQLVRDTVSHITGSWFLAAGDLHNRICSAQGGDLVEKSRKEKETHMQFEKIALMNDSSVFVKTTESLSADFLAPNGCNGAGLKESQSAGLPPSTAVLSESGAVLPSTFATRMPKLTLEKCGKETEFDTEIPELMVKLKSSTVSVPVNYESDDKGVLSSHYGIIKESVREDLYTFYGVNQPLLNPAPNLNGLNAESLDASPANSKRFSSLKLNTLLKGAESLAQQSVRPAEYVQRKAPLAHYEGGSVCKNKNLGRSRGFPRDKERRRLIQDKQTRQPSNSNGIHANDKDHPQDQLSAYNQLLRDGRLAECVDLLEDMDRRGLLDMNMVYHAKFFNICKSQKAVKEAFRFCKLVQNPTLSTFNILMSVCATSQDSEGAFQVLQLAQGAGFKADCKLYTTLISTCAKSGKVDAMFEVFHEMVNAGVEPNVHTYGALIDGCARVGQVAKAFGAYGIMRSKKVKPDRVVFNALITACGQSGALHRAFDVLAEMRAETQPIDPDHVTVGALIQACASAGQVDRAKEVYNMVHEYNIKGTPEVYTIAVNCCSQAGDWDFALRVCDDMTRKGVVPDEMFLSALIDVAGHAGKVDAAFEILQKARIQGIQLGIMPYSSLMGACSNAKNWQKALEVHEVIKSIKLNPTVSTMNALITALCDGGQLPKAIEVLSEMKSFGLSPNTITYSIILVASERKDDLEVGLMLLSQAKNDGIGPTLIMCKCIIGMCLRRFEKACALGEPILSFDSGWPQIENKWTSQALMVYRETIAAGEKPTMEVVSQVLGCLQLPCDTLLKERLVENLGVTADSSRCSNLISLVHGFGEYDPRAFSLFEEAASLGIVSCVSFKESPIVVDAKGLQIHAAKVYLLTILKGLKHRLAAGAKLPNVTILLPVDKAQIMTPEGEKTINVAGRISQTVASLLRRLGIPYQGNESYGKIRINGISLRRWLRPKLASPFSRKPEEWSSSPSQIGKGIIYQQRNIRTGNLSLE